MKNQQKPNIDTIEKIGYALFVKIMEHNVNKFNTLNENIINELLKDPPISSEINDLVTAIRFGGLIFCHSFIRNEQVFLLYRRAFASILFNDKMKLAKVKNRYDYDVTPIILSIVPYVANGDMEVTKICFRDWICSALETKEENIRRILDKIKYLWEYEVVVELIDMFGNEYTRISSLDKRNRKKEYREKVRFNKSKAKALKFLEDYNIDIKDIDKIKKADYSDYDKQDEYKFYETALKASKQLLYNSLTSRYGTGKVRAKEITEILEYI